MDGSVTPFVRLIEFKLSVLLNHADNTALTVISCSVSSTLFIVSLYLSVSLENAHEVYY